MAALDRFHCTINEVLVGIVGGSMAELQSSEQQKKSGWKSDRNNV